MCIFQNFIFLRVVEKFWISNRLLKISLLQGRVCEFAPFRGVGFKE
jgi:hypothetical protein